MNLLFCNVGWMKNYNGNKGDEIKRGGKHNKLSVGHEVCNFTDNRGTFYGYVQPTGQIKLERLGASKDVESITGVTVVWTATPETGGTVVIGWYRDATVYRHGQKIVKPTAVQQENGINIFRIKALTKNSVLLSMQQRELIIPRSVKGGIGKSNVWYADKEESQYIVKRVLNLIENGYSSKLVDIDIFQSAPEGNPRLVAHLRRERSSALIFAKKEAVKKSTGRLCCETCSFDFQERYGEHGDGFCEVHHLLPLHKADGIVNTKLDDLAIVCSNCHRIIHRSTPMLKIDELSKIVERNVNINSRRR